MWTGECSLCSLLLSPTWEETEVYQWRWQVLASVSCCGAARHHLWGFQLSLNQRQPVRALTATDTMARRRQEQREDVLHLYHTQMPEEQPGPYGSPSWSHHLPSAGTEPDPPGGIPGAGTADSFLPCSTLDPWKQQQHPMFMSCIHPAFPIPPHIQL